MGAFPLLASETPLATGIGATLYFPIGDGGFNSQTSEALTQVPVQVAASFSRLYCRVTANTVTASSTVRTRKNGANGAQSVSIGSSATGQFIDTTNTDSASPGDLFDYQLVTGGTGTTLTLSLLGIAMSGSLTTTKDYVNRGIFISTASVTQYSPMTGGNGNLTATEANTQFKLKATGTVRNGFVYALSNARATASTFGSRKNTAAGNIAVSITASTTGLFQDTANTDSVVSGDLLNYFVTTGTGTGSLQSSFAGVQIDSSTTGYVAGANQAGTTVATSVTDYFGVSGVTNSATTTEANVQAQALVAFTASMLQCRLSANTVTAASTLRLRKNTAASTQVVSITASTSGYFEDATHTDSIVATDLIDYQLVTGGTGTSLTLTNIGMMMTGSAVVPPINTTNFFAMF